MSGPEPGPFELLGLPPHADDIAIRRAYATALRAMDPQNEPAAFARLRAAYVAARAIVAREGDTGVSDEPVVPQGESPGVPDSASPSTAGVDPTVTLAWRFAADVGARRPDAIPRLLDDALAELRMQYVDAPGQFEEYLIDLVGMQRIAARADVFTAAEARFPWTEVGHLAGLGERGRWVEQVLTQRDAWLALDEGNRAGWLALCARASRALDAPTVRRWPEIVPLHERFPAWLGLHVSGETLSAWSAAFNALPDGTRDEYMRRAPGADTYLAAHVLKAREQTARRSGYKAIATFALALLIGVSHQIVSSMHGGSTPSLSDFSMRTESAERCAVLYAQMDMAGAMDRLTPAAANGLKASAHRCALAGLWKPARASP